MSTVDPQLEVSDLKRKLRLIKNKLLDPTERNLRQAISMIDDTFATEEVQMNCSRFGISCTPPPPMFAVPGYSFITPMSPMVSPMISPIRSQTVTADANVQTMPRPKLCTTSTQTTDSGDYCAFSNSTLYNVTQAGVQQAIDILTETRNTMVDRGRKRKFGGGYSTRSKTNTSFGGYIPIQKSSHSIPTGRPGVTHLQRVQQITDVKPIVNNMLTTTERLAIGDGVSGSYTPFRYLAPKKNDPDNEDKKHLITKFDFNCTYCGFRGDSETEVYYHDCVILPEVASPFMCCGTAYKHRGYYTRHRDLKHHKQSFK